MTVIEVDGVTHKPLVVDQIQIHAGQRYSFVLNANQPVGNYWIRSTPSRGPTGFANGINSAILRYVNATVEDPTTTIATPAARLQETSLVPFNNPGAPGVPTPGAADVNLHFVITNSGGRFKVNGADFTPPTVPVLLQILSGAHTAQDLLPAGSVYVLPLNSVIELSILGNSPGAPVSFLISLSFPCR
jgi:iron transport multicopper oxidase